MIIKYKTFTINITDFSYDLYQTRKPKQTHKNKNMGENVTVNIGYFSKLENCFEAIIHVGMSSIKEKIELREFSKYYNSLKNDLLSELQYLTKIENKVIPLKERGLPLHTNLGI